MKTRMIGPEGSYYHVISRVVERRFYLGSHEKEMFCRMMRRVAAFSGIQIITYCVMDNHFHILLKVPRREKINDEELYRRLEILYGRSRETSWNDPLGMFARSEYDAALRAQLRKKYLRRMYDVSEFMRTLKLRYSFWFNRTHKRCGSLWDGRFKSLLVEGAGNHHALATVAAYIDLNGVRAHVSQRPENYRWCGYADARGGVGLAQNGLKEICATGGKDIKWRDVDLFYTQILYQKVGAGNTSHSLNRDLMCRVRYFTQGAVLGSDMFVEEIFEKYRHLFSMSRKNGARKMRGCDWGGLYVARQVGQ